MKAGISGIGSALPGLIVSNEDLARRLDTDDDWIFRRTGIRTRRRLSDGEDVTTLAVAACADALADAGRAAEDVDAIIISTITPDFLTPGLAPLVAARLGAIHASAIDINAACVGFMHGLDQAAALIESGRAGLVLVCGAEVYRHAVARMVEATEIALRASDIGVDDIDFFVAHQANARIIEAAADRLGISRDRISLHVQEVANTSSASIPLALHQAERAGALHPGDTIAFAAFGAGFVWGAGVACWKEELLTATTVRHMRSQEHARAD